MKNSKFAYSMMAVVLGTALMSGSALAATTTDSAGAKIDSSMKKVDNYMGDSSITAKVKSALVDDKAIKSSDISVKTDNGVVTLSGFVGSQSEAEQAVALATKVEGVKSVSDKLHTKDSKDQSVKGYAGETTDGVVQLSGSVKDQAQSDRAESVAKTVDGVKSVKNDLKIAP